MTDESLEDLEKKLKKLEKEKEEREKKELIAQKEKQLLLKIEKLETELESLGVEFDLKQKGSELRDEKLASELKQEAALNDYTASLDKVKQAPKKKEKITIKAHLIGKTLGYKFGFLIIIMTVLFSLGFGLYNAIDTGLLTSKNYSQNYNIARSPDLNFSNSRILFNASYKKNDRCHPQLLVRIPYAEADVFYENGLDWAKKIALYNELTVEVRMLPYDSYFSTDIKRIRSSLYSPEYIGEFTFLPERPAFEGTVTLILPNITIEDSVTAQNEIVIYGKSLTREPVKLYDTLFNVPEDLTTIYQLPNSCTS